MNEEPKITLASDEFNTDRTRVHHEPKFPSDSPRELTEQKDNFWRFVNGLLACIFMLFGLPVTKAIILMMFFYGDKHDSPTNPRSIHNWNPLTLKLLIHAVPLIMLYLGMLLCFRSPRTRIVLILVISIMNYVFWGYSDKILLSRHSHTIY